MFYQNSKTLSLECLVLYEYIILTASILRREVLIYKSDNKYETGVSGK